MKIVFLDSQTIGDDIDLSEYDKLGAVSYTHLDVYKRQRNNRVLFGERSGEWRILARLSTEGAEPKGYQVLTGR